MSLTTSKNDCIVPCTYPMLKEILSSEEETLNYKGFKVDMVLFCGIIVKHITFSKSPKGNPQLVIQIQNATGTGVIEVRMTQYENTSLIEDLLKKNHLKKIEELIFQYVQLVIQIRKFNQGKWYFEAKSLIVINDYNLITNYFAKCIQYHCEKIYGKLNI